MKAFARASAFARGIDVGGPRKCGTMQNEHLPLHPSWIFRYARLVDVGTGVWPHCGTGSDPLRIWGGRGVAFGRQPVMAIWAQGKRWRRCSMAFSQSRCAFAVTEQPRTMIRSGEYVGSDPMTVGADPEGSGIVSCPKEDRRASRSSDSARLSRQPKVTNAIFNPGIPLSLEFVHAWDDYIIFLLGGGSELKLRVAHNGTIML